MLSLPALSQKYKNLYPEYIDPLAKFSPGDPRLATIKRQALSPYLSRLEEQRIFYNDHILVSAFLFDVEVNENGFIAELWKESTCSNFQRLFHDPKYSSTTQQNLEIPS